MEPIIILSIFSNNNGRRSFKPVNSFKCASVATAENYVKDNGIQLYDIKLNNKVINRDGKGKPTAYKKDSSQKEPVFIEAVNAELVIAHLSKGANVKPVTWYEFKKGNGEIGVTFSCSEDAVAAYRFLTFNLDFEILDTIKESFAISFRTLTNSFTQITQWQPKELNPAISQEKRIILNCFLIEQKYASFSWGPILQTSK